MISGHQTNECQKSRKKITVSSIWINAELRWKQRQRKKRRKRMKKNADAKITTIVKRNAHLSEWFWMYMLDWQYTAKHTEGKSSTKYKQKITKTDDLILARSVNHVCDILKNNEKKASSEWVVRLAHNATSLLLIKLKAIEAATKFIFNGAFLLFNNSWLFLMNIWLLIMRWFTCVKP